MSIHSLAANLWRGHIHHVQDADERSQREEVRVRLHEHPLDLVQLRAGRRALLLRGLGEALGQRREDGELPVRHRLELDLQGHARRRRVDLDVLRAQVPELVREDDGLVQQAVGRIALRCDFDVCNARR